MHTFHLYYFLCHIQKIFIYSRGKLGIAWAWLLHYGANCQKIEKRRQLGERAPGCRFYILAKSLEMAYSGSRPTLNQVYEKMKLKLKFVFLLPLSKQLKCIVNLFNICRIK